MKNKLIGALALALLASQVSMSTAYAADAAKASHFRSAQPQSFSKDDLQRYGLSAQDAARVSQLQSQGNKVVVMTPEEAKAVTGGEWSTTTWLWVGLGVIVVVAIVAAAND